MDEEDQVAAPETEVVGESESEVPADETVEDAEEDSATEAEEGEEQSEEQPKGRANQRIQTLAAERKEAREQAERATRELETMKREMAEIQRQIQTGSSARDAAAEAELLANMDPIQRVQYEADKKFDTLQRQLRDVQMSNLDSTDRATFLAKAQNDPVRLSLAEQVEKNLKDLREKGMNAPREDLYYYLLGKQLAEQKAKGGKSATRQAAQGRVESTQAKTASVRSDAAGGKRGKSVEDRLSNMLI